MSTEAPHLPSAEMCATCHTLYTHALNREGLEIGELPERVGRIFGHLGDAARL